MSRHRHQGHRGSKGGAATLGTAIIVLLAGSVLAAAVADIARTELAITRDRRVLAHGLAAADRCLARIVASLPAGWDHAVALAGADGVVNTADDGVLVAPSGCSATLLPGSLGALRPFLDVAAAVLGGRRRLRAIVGAAPRPLPAVVWTSSGTALGFVTGRVDLNGLDAARPDLTALPAIASPDDPSLVDAWLAGTPGVTVGGTTAPEYSPAPPFAALLARLRGQGAGPMFVPAPALPAAGLYAVAGDLTIASPGFGAGVLAVEGRLDIQADFAFSGIVAASGGVGVANGVTLRILGGLWAGTPALNVAGELVVLHDAAAVDAADALFRLPRRALVAGLVDR
jgi:hypothetical protein